MNNLLTFSYTIQSVRIHVDDQGNPWFCLKDVCDSLGIKNPSDVLQRLNRKGVTSIPVIATNSKVDVDSIEVIATNSKVDLTSIPVTPINSKVDVDSSYVTPINSGVKQSHTFIDEPNLYRVIFRSDKPEARKFQDWVFEDVLPSIRKTGQYRVATRQKAHVQQQILEQIELGNNTLNQIAVALDKSWATVQRTTNRMEHNGQIEATKVGRVKILSKNKRLN